MFRDDRRGRVHRSGEVGISDRNAAHSEFQPDTFADNGSVLDKVFVDTRSDCAKAR